MDFGIIQKSYQDEITIKIGAEEFTISRKDFSDFYKELEQLVKKYRI